METVDVCEDGHLSLAPRLPKMVPDQFSLDGFEERFGGGIATKIAPAGNASALVTRNHSSTASGALAQSTNPAMFVPAKKPPLSLTTAGVFLSH